MKGLSSALFACSLLVPGLASAKTVVLTPLVGTDVKTVANVQSLMSSELDFMSDVESVVELPKAPSTLNVACLTSTSCMGAIAKSNGGDQLVTGILHVATAEVKLDLVLYDVATNKAVRRKTWTLPNSPESIADAMGPLMRELMTGGAPKAAAAAAEASFSGSFEAEDDFAFEEDAAPKPAAKPTAAKPAPAKPTAAAKPPVEEDDFEIELEDRVDPDEERRAAEEAAIQAAAEAERQRVAEAAAKKKAEEDARRKAEADAAKKKADEEARIAAAAAAKKKAEEDARIAAAAAAKKKADEEARRAAAAEEARRAAAVAAAAAEEEEEFDPSAISFGSTTGQIEQEEIEDAIQFAPSKPSTASSSSSSAAKPAAAKPAAKPAPAPTTATRSRYDEEEPDMEEEEELDLASLDEEEEPAPRSRTTSSSSSSRDDDEEDEAPTRSRTSSSSSSSASLDRDKKGGSTDDEPATVTITVRGGYSKYYAFDFLTAGAEVGVKTVDKLYLLGGVDSYSVQRAIPPALQVEGRATEWNTIYPLNGGLAYKAGNGAVHPYIGADLIFAPYYFAEGQTSWAVGGRGRAGVDLMVADVFGFNLNVAVGGWSGKDWGIIQREIKTSGLVPQVNAGTVFAF